MLAAMHLARWAVFAASLAGAAAGACECDSGSPESKIETADAIFEATVESIGEDATARDWLVKVTVGRRWKGVSQGSLTLRARTGKACGYFFAAAKRYLVFAMRDGATLRVTTCGLTKPIEQAGDVLKKLPMPIE
jgi:hypothetical protein